MIRLELHRDDCSDYVRISQEQYEDFAWLAGTTEENYAPIHAIMQGIKKGFNRESESGNNVSYSRGHNKSGLGMEQIMTNESAIKWIEVEIKRILHESHTDDLKSTIEMNSRVEALEMAQVALEQIESHLCFTCKNNRYGACETRNLISF